MRSGVRGRNNKNKKTKKIKIIVSIIVIVLVLIALGIFAYINRNQNIEQPQQTEQKDIQEPQEKEEVTYSMTNGDDFVKIDNIIAYLNPLDVNYLNIYNIETGEAIVVETPKALSKIYFDGENIYGVPNHYTGQGIYKIDLQGNVKQIYEGESLQLWLTEDKIYFVKQNGFDQINQIPQGDLCLMDKDGGNITTIIPNTRNYFKIKQDKIYYSNMETKGLYVADLNGENSKELAKGRITISAVTNDYIIYLDFADEEKYHVLYLSDMTNHEVGRFGNCYIRQDEAYLFTRKLTGEDNNVENKLSIFKIDSKNKEEKQIYTYKSGLSYLTYVYQNKAYIDDVEMQRVDLESGEIEGTVKTGYYLDGYCYELTRKDDLITDIWIYNLETLEEKNITLSYMKTVNYSNKNSGTTNQVNNQNTVNTSNTQENSNSKYNWINESTEGKTAITEEQAINIWKKEISNLGKNNNIINYEDYTKLLSIQKSTQRPNSLFMQTDNSNPVMADFTREVWQLETVEAETKGALQTLFVYIDCYTGKIVGGRIAGD